MKLIDAMDKGHETVRWATWTFGRSSEEDGAWEACSAGLAATGLGGGSHSGRFLMGLTSKELGDVCQINNDCGSYKEVKQCLIERGLADKEVDLPLML